MPGDTLALLGSAVVSFVLVVGVIRREAVYRAVTAFQRSPSERWRSQLTDDGQLVCEDCDEASAEPGAGIIVNKPVQPDESVDLEQPTQVLCQAHIKQHLEHPGDEGGG